jgi:hypothetical protein
VGHAGVDHLHQPGLLALLQLNLTHLPDACGGGHDRLRADREAHCEGVPPGAVALVALVVALTTSGLCPFQPHILTKIAQGGHPDTMNTLITISQPAGSHHLAADQKLGKVRTGRKQALFSS